MKKIFLFILFPFIVQSVIAQNDLQSEVANTLDDWHKAAAAADFENYFDKLTDDSVFIGTDATENWSKSAFEAYAKPYFDKGKAWSFNCLQRHIYFNKDNTLAWFDELLNTKMKICRGSGVLILKDGKWQIKHYVLSMTIPNDIADDVVKLKSPIENSLITILKSEKN